MSDGQEYLFCPFDPVHKILKHRLPKHIVQCKKNHPNTPLVVCPFNVIHYVLPKDMDHHMIYCEDRSRVELIYVSAVASPYVPSHADELAVTNVPLVVDAWGEAEEQVSYLAVKDKLIQDKPLLLMGEQNLGKAARKNILKAELERHQHLKDKKK